jgi:hypothetical protein
MSSRTNQIGLLLSALLPLTLAAACTVKPVPIGMAGGDGGTAGSPPSGGGGAGGGTGGAPGTGGSAATAGGGGGAASSADAAAGAGPMMDVRPDGATDLAADLATGVVVVDAPAPPAPADAGVPVNPVPLPVPGGPCPLPACLAALVSDCPTTGACVAQPASLGGGFNQCYASGVKVATTEAPPLTVARVTRPDGTLCSTVDGLGRVGRGGGMGGANDSVMIFRDPSGQSVASGAIQGAGGGADVILSCATGGVPVRVPLSCTPVAAALGGLVGGGAQAGPCGPGVCP